LILNINGNQIGHGRSTCGPAVGSSCFEELPGHGAIQARSNSKEEE
jgi:hypothetical protein